METSLEPSDLVQASELLLNLLSPKLKRAFRLVVNFSEKQAFFKICLKTSLWFDVYLRTMPDFAMAVNIARQYVTKTRLNISPQEDAPFVIDYKETEKDKAFIICPIFRDYGTCKYTKNCGRGDHPEIYCKGAVVTKDGRKSTCNFYFITKLVVNDLSNDKYVVMLRREPFRELLLIPRPNNESNNCGHYTNETLVRQETFWKDLLSRRQSLNFHSIAINYGEWETLQSQNKYAQECHAHVHLYFSSDTWKIVREKITNSDISLKFSARDYPEPNYLLIDCDELENERLRSAEHLLMLNAIQALNENFTDTMKENTKVLEALNKNFTDTMKENNKFNENLTDTMKENTKVLEALNKNFTDTMKENNKNFTDTMKENTKVLKALNKNFTDTMKENTKALIQAIESVGKSSQYSYNNYN
ncbi:hypothetical protein RhiirA4_464162 [Rhizophagus irregularis]|uniref:C3H1-type domain-containing protein n=1 Tax=Rhizophagus irregularis TaxID=588596 RepID=A0A2I1GPF8_9GLOM|nr:hypothetical protein RhiirA4_464162 [Rhizophagus irregularis]